MKGVDARNRKDGLKAHAFDASMKRCLPHGIPRSMAVGCSGGPDSMALTAHMQGWAEKKGVAMTAVIVDHGLRAESNKEARQVAAWLAERGVTAEILRWTGARPDRNVQAEARRIRYALIADWCMANHVPVLAVAHHVEDQAETFLLRLARGSGVYGLAAMPRASDLDTNGAVFPIRLIRPVLDVSKRDLRAILTAREWPWVEDPSNHDRSHARIRMRQLMAALAEEGLDAQRLANTAARMRRARASLEAACDQFFAESSTLNPLGFVTLDLEALRRAPDEIALRVLTSAVRGVAGRDYPVRLEKLEACIEALMSGVGEPVRTLGGCQLEAKRGVLSVFREVASVQDAAPAAPTLIWDRRFRLSIAGDLADLSVRKLGREGQKQAKAAFGKGAFDTVPAPARRSLPALWREDELIAVSGVQQKMMIGDQARFDNMEFLFRPGAQVLV